MSTWRFPRIPVFLKKRMAMDRSVPLISDPVCANFDRKYTYSCLSSKTSSTTSGPGCCRQKKPSLALLLHLLTIVFLVSMAPYSIFTITLNYLVDNAEDPYEEFDRLINYQRILKILIAFNPTLNFILYFLSGSKFRDEVKALVSCKTTQLGSVF